MSAEAREALALSQDVLDECLTFFSRGTTSRDAPPSQRECIDVLHSLPVVAHSIAPDELAVALEGCRVYQLAVALAVEPLLYAQTEESGSSLQQTFAKVRLAAMEAVGELVAAVGRSRTKRPDPQFYAATDTVEALLSHVAAPMTLEALRMGAAQCLFCLVAAVPHRMPANLVQAVVQCAAVEPAAMVRAAILCVVRELCNSNGAALELEMPTLFKLLEVDDSHDARVLAAESLTVLATPENVAPLAESAVAAVRHRLEAFQPDTEHAEAAATAFLVDRLCAAHPRAVFPEVTRQRLERALLHAGIVTYSPDVIATLRRIIDRCPPSLRLGQQLLANFQAFSGLLKIVLDSRGSADDSHGAGIVQCGVEASAAVAVLLAQSPGHRQQMRRELHAFPMWATTLKDALLHYLNATTLEYFEDIDLVDVTNVRMNDPELVEWNERDRPHRNSIHNIFSAQEQRFTEGTVHDRAPPRLELNELASRRRDKITFVVLCYAVHAALGEDMQAPHHPPSHAPLNNPAAMETIRQGAREAAAAAAHTTPGARTRQDGGDPAPKFPTPRSARGARALHRDPVTPAERQELAFAYDKFDSAFKLTRHFAKCYAQAEQRQPQYEATPDGFVVRQQQLRNPWGTIVKKPQVKSWSVKDLKEGDLFYFAVPFDELSRAAIECVLERARRHTATLKRAFVTTPQTARGRRWLIYDMLHHVMPGVETLLRKVHALLGDYGDENVRFPVFLFREKEMHLGERALHSGNLAEVVDQVEFYFSQHPAEIFGAPDDAQAIQRLEERLRELAQSGFDPGPVEDNGSDGGHGGLSSDSEMDD